MCQTACKPGSVHAAGKPEAIDGHSSGTPVAGRLVQPTRTAARKHACRPSPEGNAGRPSLFGLAPGGVYHAVPVAGNAVRSYRTLSPLPGLVPLSWNFTGRFAFCGTVPGVTPAGRYPAPCFRGARTFLPRSRNPEGSHPTVWRGGAYSLLACDEMANCAESVRNNCLLQVFDFVVLGNS